MYQYPEYEMGLFSAFYIDNFDYRKLDDWNQWIIFEYVMANFPLLFSGIGYRYIVDAKVAELAGSWQWGGGAAHRQLTIKTAFWVLSAKCIPFSV
jgi:hypothetical protein